jgi:peptide/nickel transport system permease protein
VKSIKRILSALRKYPTAIIALAIIGILLGTSIATMIAIPLSEAKRLWQTSSQAWEDSPKRAEPVWTNWFRSAKDKLPETIVVSTEGVEPVSVEPLGSAGIAKQTITEIHFEFPYYIYPSEVALTFYATYQSSAPLGRITWITPDGREFIIHDSVMDKRRHVLSTDAALARQLGAQATILGLFSSPDDVMRDLRFETATPQRGTYTLRVLSKTFEADSTLDVKLVVYGEVSGIAGTDHLRRGLIVGLLWGTPIALMFGIHHCRHRCLVWRLG